MPINAKANVDKCHLLVSCTQKANIKIENFWIDNSEIKKLLRIKSDCKVTFDEHVLDLCVKKQVESSMP